MILSQRPPLALLVFLLAAWLPTQSLAAPRPSEAGEKIYQLRCAGCHGDRGQGVQDAHDEPLRGDASLAELTKLIVESMPEDAPETCVGEDAVAVATYVYQQFYQQSSAVPEQPRLRLGRLTAPQLRQSLADLYQRYDQAAAMTSEHGLKAQYSNRDREDGKAQFDRVDATIDFDFGHDGPGQGINPENFSIRWTGAFRPEETGEHELIVRCENSFIMYFGDYRREFINNHVQSAERTEFRRSVFLTAGSVHPLSITLNQRKRKTEQPPVKISLSWKTPRGVEQVIPARALLNVNGQPTFSLQTRLPADDRSYGYERGIAVDEPWNASTTTAAIEFANAIVGEVWPQYRRRHKNDPPENRAILRGFLTGLVETAFRGPLDDELRQRYIDRHLEATESDQEAIKRVMLLALKSPRFLYPLVDSDRSRSQRAANRLALTLYDSLPVDAWLRDAVANDQLQTESDVRRAAERMMADWRVQAKLRSMLHTWLNFEHFADLRKSPERHPGFDGALESDLRASMDQFLDQIVWSEESDFRQLFLSTQAFTSPRIAKFYGHRWRAEQTTDGLQPTSHDELHMGVLSHPLMMSGLAYDDSTSPIHRGVFLLRYALGRTLRPPNEAFTPFSPDLHPDLTTRERVSLQTNEKNCQVCHSKINPLGFSLEYFDAVGRYQTEQVGRAIDATGSYTTSRGDLVEFDGPRELAEFLAHDEDAHRAFIRRAFQFLVKQPPAAFADDLEARLLQSFQENNYSIHQLIVEIAVAASHQAPATLVSSN